MKKHGHVVAARIAAALLGCAAAVALAQAPAEAGRRDFLAKCATCHGKDGKGGGPYADQLKHAVPDLTTMAKRSGGHFPSKKAAAIIEGAGQGHGPRDMPVWGLDYTVEAAQVLPDMPVNQAQFVRGRIAALVAHLERIQAR